MTLFYAHPEDPSEEGFYFKTTSDFEAKADERRETHRLPVDSYSFEFIEGGQIDRELFETWNPGFADIAKFIAAAGKWPDDIKIKAIIALNEGAYPKPDILNDPGSLEIELCRVSSLKELAEQFVDESRFGTVPKPLERYVDREAIARDLIHDGYREIIIAGERLIYRAE